jgi:hypothetical protein
VVLSDGWVVNDLEQYTKFMFRFEVKQSWEYGL